MPDPSTIRLADRDRPERSIASLYESEFGKLARFFRRKLGNPDDAADLAQDVFVRLVRIAPETDLATPEAYLRQIANNLLRDHSSSAATRFSRHVLPLDEGLDAADDVDQHRSAAAREELALVEAALARLKPKTAEIYRLHRLDGLTYKQIGNRLGMSEGGIKRHMVKAIAHMSRLQARLP